LKWDSIRDRVAPLISFEESGYFSKDTENYWSAKSLYEQAKKEKARAYKFPLEHFDFTIKVYEHTERLTDLAYHFRRIMNADCSIPIIVSPLGDVLDGYHRILKAVVTRETVYAYRLKEMPPANIHPNPDKEEE